MTKFRRQICAKAPTLSGVMALLLPFWTVSAQPALAAHHSIDCNANGYVLQPDTRYRARETIYLGKSCDAYSDAYDSSGKWCWANAGILVQYNNGETFNKRMELPVCAQIETEIRACECN